MTTVFECRLKFSFENRLAREDNNKNEKLAANIM